MVNPYSTEADVRKEAGGIDSTVDLPSHEVVSKIAAADREIDDATDHDGLNGNPDGWNGTEPDFSRVAEISKILAAASSRLRFEPEKSQAQRDYGLMLLQELSSEMGDSGLVAQTNEKQTFPSNPNKPWYGGRYVLTGIPEVTVDPDSIYEQS